MHLLDLTTSASQTIPAIHYHSMAIRLMEQKFAPRGRTVDMPYIVDCPTLTPSRFKSPGEFHQAVAKRQAWCRRYAYGGYAVEPLSDATRLRFAVGAVATLFRLIHETDQAHSSKGGG